MASMGSTSKTSDLIDRLLDLVLRLERAVEAVERMPAHGLGHSEAESQAIDKAIQALRFPNE